MKTLLLTALAISFGGVLIAGDSPHAEAILKSYQTDLVKLTAEPHLVNAMLFMLCKSLTTDEIKKIQQEQTGPHFLTSVDIYTNQRSIDAVKSKSPDLPVGTVIVKEKSKASSLSGSDGEVKGTAGIGGMIKRAPGFDPENGDWDYFYSDNEGKVTSGKLENCIKCHTKAAGTDHVFGSWLAPILKKEGETTIKP